MAEIIKKFVQVRDRFGSWGYRTVTLGVTWHYIGVAGQTPEQAFTYFNDPTKTTYSGCHYCIGVDGRIYQFADADRAVWHAGGKSYTQWALNEYPEWTTQDAGKTPNWAFIGVELCHPDDTGRFTEPTLKSAAWLARQLISEYNLKSSDMVRHYDLTGKDCPKWWVATPQAWAGFKRRLR